jgi:ABC-type uncharacterized transport system substrate-binding protein
MKTILAVAVGNRDADVTIDNPDDLSDLKRVRVRPYVRGLTQGLDALGYRLGKDYVITFRLRTDPTVGTPFTNPDPQGGPFIIFCMSTTIVKLAHAAVVAQRTPIVGIVSAPGTETVGGGAAFDTVDFMCGISAKRSQTADECFDCFYTAVPTLQKLYILTKSGYGPATRAANQVRAAAVAKGLQTGNIIDKDVATASNLDTFLRTQLEEVNSNRPTVGIQVLPVDFYLSRAQDIIKLAQDDKGVPTFFPVPDVVKPDGPSALGAHGVPQRRCGMLMAERVYRIWTNSPPDTVPTQGASFQRWANAGNYEFEFVVSGAVAKDLGIKLNPLIPKVI